MERNFMIKSIILLFLVGCISNYSITMVHSQGTASDVVDETSTAAPKNDLSPTISIP